GRSRAHAGAARPGNRANGTPTAPGAPAHALRPAGGPDAGQRQHPLPHRVRPAPPSRLLVDQPVGTGRRAPVRAKSGFSTTRGDRSMQYPQWIWHNGTIRPWAEATTHVMAHALHYGSSVF